MRLNKNRNINLTEGSIVSGIIYFAIPLLLSNFLQQLYNTADLMMVGKFAGKEPMAAVGATGPVASLLIGLFLGLTTGASVVVSQFYGSSDRKSLHNSIHTAYAVSIVGGIILSAIGYFLSPIILSMLDTPKEIIGDAVTYMRIFFIGVTPLLIYNMGSGILRSIGDSKRPFNFLLISAIINIILNYILIRIFNLSILGSALSTLISQIIAAILVTYNLIHSDRIFKLNIKEIKFYKDTLALIFKIGIPTGIQSSVISLSNVLIQAKVNSFGAEAIAGFAAEGRIDGFILMAIQALALAATTFAGQNFGAKKFNRIREGVKISLILVLTTAASLAIIGNIFIRPIIGLFSNDEEVIQYGVTCFRYLSSGFIIFGVSEILGGFVRGAGKALIPMVISIFSMCGLRMIWIYTALEVWTNIEIIYISYPISWVVTCILNALYFKFGNWRQ